MVFFNINRIKLNSFCDKVKICTLIVMLLFYILIVIFSLFHHELWRDEARVWYLVSFSDLKELFDSVRYDGHPFLWYAILLPFGQMKLPVITMQFISIFFSCCAVFLFFFKTKVNLFVKFLFAFSAGMLWFIPVSLRSYVLIPFFGLIWAIMYNKRKVHPFLYTAVLMLLSQTHMLIWGLSFISLYLFSAECLFSRNKKLVLFIPATVIIYTIFMFYIYKPVFLDNIWCPNLSSDCLNLSFYKKLFRLNDLITPHLLCSHFFSTSFYLSLLIIFLFQLIIDRKMFLICTFSVGYALLIISSVYFGGIYYQKIFVLMLIPVFCTSAIFNTVYKNKNFISRAVLNLPFALYMFSVFMTYPADKILVEDFNNQLSGVKEISEYIYDNKISDSEYVVILPPYDFKSDTFYVYFPRTFSSKNIKETPNIAPRTISKIVQEIKQKNDKVMFVITPVKLDENDYSAKYELIISPDKIMEIPLYSDEYYYLYKLK